MGLDKAQKLLSTRRRTFTMAYFHCKPLQQERQLLQATLKCFMNLLGFRSEGFYQMNDGCSYRASAPQIMSVMDI